MTQAKTALIGLTREELESFAREHGQPEFRGRQLYRWLYARRERSFAQMSDLPKAFRDELPALAEAGSLAVVRRTSSARDGTQKFLFELVDGLRIESVYLPESPGQTVCISTQVGCAVGCTYCATGRMGFYRNLSAGEIVLQVMEIERLTRVSLTNVVYMGMGEPLHNYENVVKSVRLLADKSGLGFAKSRITVSTVGIVPGIERWCRDNPPAKLAVSLHATTDERRQRMVPVARAFPLADLMKSLRRLAHVTRFPVTFEYIMIAGLNDRREDAANLRLLLRNIPAKINLIRLHPTESGLRPTDDEAIHRFMGWLTEERIACTLRESRGVENNAACGMLFSEERFEPKKARRV
jgi:23S rRNA (adenine2503-C2)-methyltransferase